MYVCVYPYSCSIVFMVWISAPAVCAVLKVPFRAAAIPAIPVASAHVILIVAIAITSPFRYETSACTLVFLFVFWILAGAGTILEDLLPRAKVILRQTSFAI